jgi:PEGA domain
MRARLAPVIAFLGAVACAHPASPGDLDTASARGRDHPNLEAARAFDQSGVASFRDGHYADAIRYFRASYRMGGPSSELWNLARCRERLDDAEGAARAIDEYLAQRDLAPADRAEAERELRSLRARPSLLTVATSPAGAVATLDSRQVLGTTPVSAEVPPGSHTLSIRRDGYAAVTHPFEARYGHAVIVSLDLAQAGK